MYDSCIIGIFLCFGCVSYPQGGLCRSYEGHVALARYVDVSVLLPLLINISFHVACAVSGLTAQKAGNMLYDCSCRPARLVLMPRI